MQASSSAWATPVAGRHVVIRHREPTLRHDLLRRIAELEQRGALSVSLVTNGRLLLYPKLAHALARAGAGRLIVKLFGLDAAAHDHHTRETGSWEQTVRGISTAREAGVEVLVTFPIPPEGAERETIQQSRIDLARRLTGKDAVEMPEPLVEAHPNEYRYDVVVLRSGVSHPLWIHDNFFPMAHLNTGPVCNIRCTYCNVHGGDDQRLYDAAYVERIIDDAGERVATGLASVGTPTADFIGGEPTLHPELARLIRRARERGFKKVYICTNGVRLLRPGYLDSLVEAGLTGVRFSFHEHRPEVANSLADVAGLGDTYVDVARMLLCRKDVHAHIYRIILANTIDSLEDYIRWLDAHNESGRPIDLTFGMPSMRGRLFENRHLYPPLAGLREKLGSALALARSLGIEPLIHHAPACLLPEEPHRPACLHVTMMQFDAMTGNKKVMNFEGDARYGAACQTCSVRSEGCAGLPSAYFEADRDAAEAWLSPLKYKASAPV